MAIQIDELIIRADLSQDKQQTGRTETESSQVDERRRRLDDVSRPDKTRKGER